MNGIKLAYRTAGEGPPLVLLHGRTDSGLTWAPFVVHFARRFQVIRPDLRGHGKSPYPGSYALPDMAEDVARLLDDLGVERAAVIGHSLGGMVAYHLAMLHPSRVSRMVLEDPPPPLPIIRAAPEVDPGDPQAEMLLDTERQFAAPDPAWAEGLGRVTVPTMVLYGGPSTHVPADRTAALIPGAKLVTIDVGHLIHADAPQEFLAAVDDFLQDPLEDV
ncbi:alpha/beta fold hydrolase [Nonomuraea sp. NPDC050556]|uniref:alpha/beta fold hydrolase n=1 Tax=Nonomuraea sp. NPDC050556 TaxID=3364369 RepID=UPI0037BA6462